ncbi:MAG: acyltransferase family protein [Clostridia bacterium]|nr:acyltransferase family protein [Clostridia bacterium]
MTRKAGRVPGYDLLRVLATLAVILLHSATSQLHAVEVNTSPWRAMIFWDGLMRWSVPAFFLLSGALFLSSDKPLSEILKKNALRIGTAYFFWSFVYAAVSRPEGWKEFLYTWIGGHYHLWFCWAIVPDGPAHSVPEPPGPSWEDLVRRQRAARRQPAMTA